MAGPAWLRCFIPGAQVGIGKSMERKFDMRNNQEYSVTARNRATEMPPADSVSRITLAYMLLVGLLAFLLGAALADADTVDGDVDVSDLAYKVVVDDDLATVRDSLVSALEGRNYSIVNTLNVQEALNNRDIQAAPILLVEFINLTKAYQITKSDHRFELFAPLRAALFEERHRVKVLILRPRFIGEVLGRDKLSETARAVLEDFDRDMHEVAESVLSGGF